MTTQQRLDFLLKHLDALAESQGDMVALSAQDIALLMETCGFANRGEIGFYIAALAERRLVSENCSPDNAILQASITIDGYCHLDTLRAA
ncbi:MAG: hypothetical protein F4213_21620 [Boseongicola sp. SB0677_bin_26]|nr:hypothetical protein [Boseongicola sp. SB0665_bin_10]MYG28580.1 hypothetical protein [Boseongicola sp. SB0677_bin_26]